MITLKFKDSTIILFNDKMIKKNFKILMLARNRLKSFASATSAISITLVWSIFLFMFGHYVIFSTVQKKVNLFTKTNNKRVIIF